MMSEMSNLTDGGLATDDCVLYREQSPNVKNTIRYDMQVYNVIPKKPQHVFFHVLAQTTHVVAAPHGFACVGIPATRLYIPSFIEIRSRVSEPHGVKIWPFPLLWLVDFYNSLYYRTSREVY